MFDGAAPACRAARSAGSLADQADDIRAVMGAAGGTTLRCSASRRRPDDRLFAATYPDAESLALWHAALRVGARLPVRLGAGSRSGRPADDVLGFGLVLGSAGLVAHEGSLPGFTERFERSAVRRASATIMRCNLEIDIRDVLPYRGRRSSCTTRMIRRSRSSWVATGATSNTRFVDSR
jgi:hypothetical protein